MSPLWGLDYMPAPYGKAEWALEDGEWPPSSCVFSILLDDFGTKPTREKHDDKRIHKWFISVFMT